MPEFTTLLYAVEDGVATITLNRPDRMNAFNIEMGTELVAAFDATDADDAVKTVILTGAGKAFCAGADLRGGASTFDPERRAAAAAEHVVNGVYRDGAGRVTLRIFESLKPVIAAINGAAVGAGATVPLAADIRLASEDARFGFVFSRRGMIMEGSSSWFLPRAVGLQTACEWIYSGRVFPAAEALERGLVRSLHAPADLLPAARRLAREFADNAAPVSVALMRQMLWRISNADHPMEAHTIDSRMLASRGGSADAREGVQSFLDKRPPQFPNRVSQDLPPEFPWWSPRAFS